MKIYTRKGDSGHTSIIGGVRLPKNHLRINAYGAVDETNAWIGLLRDTEHEAQSRDILLQIQDRLFVLGAQLASDPERSQMKLRELQTDDLGMLEQEIDRMEAGLPLMKSFILPGGDRAVSYCHIARAVCRRAERDIMALHDLEKVHPLIIAFINRLSDYLFVLGRKRASDLSAKEIRWPLKP